MVAAHGSSLVLPLFKVQMTASTASEFGTDVKALEMCEWSVGDDFEACFGSKEIRAADKGSEGVSTF